MISTWMDYKDAQIQVAGVNKCVEMCPWMVICLEPFLSAPETCCRGCMRVFVAVWGTICMAVVIGWVNNPWQSSIQMTICSIGLFFGFELLGVFLLVVQSGFQKFRDGTLWAAVALFSVASLCLVGRFVAMYIGLTTLHARRGDGVTHIWPEVLVGGNEFESSELMKHDFKAYCKGEQGTLHAYTLLNVAAVFEWAYILCIFTTVFAVLIRTLVYWPLSVRDDAADLEHSINKEARELSGDVSLQ